MQQRHPAYSAWHKHRNLPGMLGGGVGTPPSALAGYALEYSADITYTDAGTTPCTADGDLIYRFKDLAGLRNADQSDSAKRAAFDANSVGSHASAVPDGTSNYYTLASSLSLGDFTILMVAQPDGNGGSVVGNNNNTQVAFNNLVNDTVLVQNDTGAANVLILGNPLPVASFNIWTLRRQGDVLTFRRNGITGSVAPTYAFNAAAFPITLYLSRRTGLGFTHGPHAALVVYSQYHADADIRKVEAWYAAKYSIPLA